MRRRQRPLPCWNPPPETRSTGYETRDLRPKTRNPRPGTRDPEPETRNPKPETRNPRPETRDQKPETLNPKPETRDPKPETRDPRPETRNPKPQTRDRSPETEKTRHTTDAPPGTALLTEAGRPTRRAKRIHLSLSLEGLVTCCLSRHNPGNLELETWTPLETRELLAMAGLMLGTRKNITQVLSWGPVLISSLISHPSTPNPQPNPQSFGFQPSEV